MGFYKGIGGGGGGKKTNRLNAGSKLGQAGSFKIMGEISWEGNEQ